MKKIFILLLTFVSSHGLFAQGSNFIIAYPISFPMGDLSDYIDDVSFRGITFEYNARVKENMLVGMELSWHVFASEEPSKVYTDGTASISGKQFRAVNSVPILANFKYFKPLSKKNLQPYLGVGVGTLYVERATDFGLYRLTVDAWQFCVRPEVGIMIGNNTHYSGLIGLKYYQGFGTNDLDAQSYLSINIGLLFHSY